MSFEQTVPGPFQTPWMSAHEACVRTVHPAAVPSAAAQHAPVGAGRGQGLAEQVVPAPCQWPWQLAWVVIAHVTALLDERPQHAPVTGGLQVSFPHVVFGPCQTPAHAACVVITHRLVGLVAVGPQHAPVGAVWGQVSALHTVPAPRHVPLHPDSVVIVHCTAPAGLLGRQHAPATGGGPHRTAVHAELSP